MHGLDTGGALNRWPFGRLMIRTPGASMDAMPAGGELKTDALSAHAEQDPCRVRRLPAAQIALVPFSLVEVEEPVEEGVPVR